MTRVAVLRIRLFTWELLMGLLATLVPRHVIIHPLLILKAAVLRPLQLEATIAQRKAEVSAKPSWTKKLVGNPELLCSEIREEADELCRTVQEIKGRERTISEMADLLYHTMVLLAVQDVKVREVLEVLRGRFSKSGIEEKNNRSTKS